MNELDLLTMLSKHNIKYDVYEHPSLNTVEESKKLRGKIKGIHTKNLFLKNKKNKFFLFSCQESTIVDLKQLKKALNLGNISFARENPVSQSEVLAGNISSSLKLEDTDNWFFDNVLLSAIAQYKEEYPTRYQEQNLTMTGCDHDIFSGNKNAPFGLCSFWVNFQRQHEFNPIHYHSGIYSFAIMMKIPYDWREQYELPHIKASNSPSAGNFEFLYTDIMGNIKSIPYKLDPASEGLMLFFPASTRHLVYPFYECEEERITISGNIILYDLCKPTGVQVTEEISIVGGEDQDLYEEKKKMLKGKK